MCARHEIVLRKRAVRRDDFAAGRDEGAGHRQDQTIGAVADDNVIARNAIAIGEGRKERPPAIGISVEIVQHLENSGLGLGRRSERIFIGGELDDVGLAGLALEFRDRFAGTIRFEGGNVRGDMNHRGRS